MRIYYLLLALIATSWCAHSQNTVSGKVATPQNQPLDGAHIHIEQLHGTTRPDGYYELHGISTGRHRIVISYIGYKSLDTLVDVSGGILLDAILKPEAMQLQEVVLTDATVAKNAVQYQKLKAETLEKYSNATLGDALKEIAGVSALKTGSTVVKPVINGLHSSRVPVIVNNVRLEDQQWGTEHAPNLDINSAGRVEVIKGAGALQYGGDAVGGMILAEPLRVLKDTIFGRSIVTGDTKGRGGSVASSLHKGAERGWAWNANGTFKYYGDRESPDYIISNTGNREGNFAGDARYSGDTFDATAAYSFYNAAIGIAKASHTGSTADLVRAINNGQPSVIEQFTYQIDAPRQEVRHHLAKANFNTLISETGTLAIQYAFQLNRRKEYDMRRAQYEDIPALDLRLVTHSFNADWKKETTTTVIKAGISAAVQDNEASPDTDIRPLIPNYSRYDAGAYGIYTHRITESITAEAGVRYDFSHVSAQKFYLKTRWNNLGYNDSFAHFITADYVSQWLTRPKFTYHNVSASAGLRKKLGDSLELLGNFSLAMRNPNPAELFSDGLHHSNATIELGNLRMRKEKAYKFSATLLKNSNGFRFEVTPYLNAVSDFIYLNPAGLEYTIRGSFPVYDYLQTNALLAGLDLQANWDINQNVSHSFSFAYVHGTDTTTGEPLIDMPPLNITNTIRYTNRQWHNLFAELRSEAVFRQGRYPNNNFEAEVPQNGELVPVLADISTPPAGYHLMHVTTGAQFSLGRATASVRLSVYNLFNTAYRDYLNRQRFYTDDVGRNIQLQLKFNY